MSQKTVSVLYQTLGLTIRRMRKAAGKTQVQLAEEVNLSRASVVNIEQGRHHPQLHVLYDIASALGCEPTDLLPPSRDVLSPLPGELGSRLKPDEREPVMKLLRMAKSTQGQ